MLDDRAILEDLANGIEGGPAAFFERLAERAARAIGAERAVVVEVLASGRVRRLGGTAASDLGDEGDITALAGTISVPLRAIDGETIGHLAVEGGDAGDPRRLVVLRAYAIQAAAELARRALQRTLSESIEQYRDLYEEAPIAYVHEDLDSNFISANRTALRILGVEPHQVSTTRGKDLVPNTPEAKKLVDDAFASINRGTDTSGVVLELQRLSDKRHIYVQWWSRPAPNGQYTRTMFLDITEHVLMQREQARLTAQNLYLQEEIKSVHNFEEIIGQSPALLAALESVERVAKTSSTVLITGETGTGKELIARAIHSTSKRHDKPLIKLNCAALPTGLVESELFGHERGAFSGAIQRRIGRFELAHQGTIFLDEVGEMPLDAQVKLLRVLQEGEFERVGGKETIKVDVRVVAATNRDLRKAVAAGEFREDLFYRLNVFPLELPPLRERKEDIPLLVRFFMQKHAPRVDRPIDGVETETMDRLVAYPWPGNIRELQNLIERAMILARSTVLRIEPETLRTETRSSPSGPVTSIDDVRDLDSVQRDAILEALQQTGNVIEGDRGAAKRLGLHPNTLRGRMKKLGIKRPT